MKPDPNRSGFTLIELLFVVALLAIVLIKGAMVMSSANKAISNESSAMELDDHGRQVLDRIAWSIMSSDRRALAPVLTPDQSKEINYQVSLGLENGAVVWGAPEKISLEGALAQQVVWRRDPDQATEMKAVWSNRIFPVQDESINGVDDNGNQLVDEEGVAFIVDGNSVRIILTMGFTDEDGQRVTRVLEKTVTCRNNPLDLP